MSIKNIIVVVATLLLIIVLFQNKGSVPFTILFVNTYVSKLTMLTSVAVVAFLIGFMAGRPKKAKYDIGAYHDAINKKDDDNTLSEEDRDYIN